MAVRVSRILHAGYLIECDQTRIVFDPLFENPFSRNCHAFPAVQFDMDQIQKLRFDAVFISHYHDDHCSFESLQWLSRQTPIYMYCVHEEMFSLLRELGFEHIHSLKFNQPVKIGQIQVTPWKALDEDVDSLFQIQADNLNILNVVDSWIDPETLNQLTQEPPWDLVLWPFQTMRELEVLSPERPGLSAPPTLPNEWLEQIQSLNPRAIIPSSCQFLMEDWSWYNRAFFPISYKFFENSIFKILPHTLVQRLNPGAAITIDGHLLQQAPRLPWIHPKGNQDVDYEFDPLAIPSSTEEIAKHFPQLSELQKNRVLEFCQHQILEMYPAGSDDCFFNSPRTWRLKVFESQGTCHEFTYQLFNGQLKTSLSQFEDWSTEVPMTKLYGALEQGESLTSMYVRVVGAGFEDLVDDPLISSLFTGKFASYQKAQLKKIISST